ncbi:ENTH/VHS [Cryptosporidium meleagridis]
MLCLIIFSASSSEIIGSCDSVGDDPPVKPLFEFVTSLMLELEFEANFLLILPALTASSYPSLILFKDFITSKVNFLSLLSNKDGFLKFS